MRSAGETDRPLAPALDATEECPIEEAGRAVSRPSLIWRLRAPVPDSAEERAPARSAALGRPEPIRMALVRALGSG